MTNHRGNEVDTTMDTKGVVIRQEEGSEGVLVHMKDGGSRNAADGRRNAERAKLPIVGRVLLKGHHVGGTKYCLDPRWSLAMSQNGEELGEGTSLKRGPIKNVWDVMMCCVPCGDGVTRVMESRGCVGE